MTRQELVIVSAYTGVCLSSEADLYRYILKLFSEEEHQIFKKGSFSEFKTVVKERSRNDFINLEVT